MENNIDVVDEISSLLDSEKYKEALSLPNNVKFAQSFKENCWDLISIIINKVHDDTIILKPSLHGACEQLLNLIVEKATPEEALLEFIEQVEVAKNDAQFSIILMPLQQLLERLKAKRGRSLEWCLNSISTYIETIPTPEYFLEQKERLLMDCDNNIRRVVKVYSLIPRFYKPFIAELKREDNVKVKQTICAFLVSLLGKPIIYIDLDPDSNAQSEARQTCSTIIDDICSLEKNVLKFLFYIEECSKEKKISRLNEDSGEELSAYENKDKINMTSLAGLFYVVFSGHFNIMDNAIPQVYSIEYIVHTSLLAVNNLLCNTEYGPLSKALSLCKALLNRLPIIVTYDVLSIPVHFNLLKGLVNVAIYSNYEVIRKTAVNLISVHVNKFQYKGRCLLIKYIFEIANHSGMIGYAITLYKNSINEAFKNPVLDECFTGDQLMYMVRKICHLPHGAQSDLVELADQIITALNFLRYLILKDTLNQSGIKNNFSYIESDYLENLRTGLNLSKAHYEQKLKEIENKNYTQQGVDVSINVGGNTLDNIPIENKREILHSALNAFHLIEGLVARLSESLRKSSRAMLPLTTISINNHQRIIRTYCQKSEIQKGEIVSTLPPEQDEQQYEQNVKDSILSKALDFVPKFGWSVESLSHGAEAAGYPGITHGLFPNGGGDLVHYFNVKCNEELVEKMKSWPKEDLKNMKVPVQLIENAIMTRLLMIQPYKSTWPKAMAIQALPNNVPNSLATLLSLVDDICYHSGDRSVDFNWYIRRVGLAGIYKASELFYLTDNSQDATGTRNFVKSRISDAELIQTALNMNPVSVAPQTLTAAFVTAKNMLGLNTLK
ncbi:Ubiquinone biosynthesis protein COQ9, mitochondrial [Papilio xuthus]|uniref:Ubiquinone biosynthesis protein COQ9, mitochondrial n=1 Tax=Papilio xuthus TaxID=66420 RepID=A0A194PKQ8_PAPXU|nr:Ubiquinone biosynthesis protein COQ9, mitochondrial [Papilio xuthus]